MRLRLGWGEVCRYKEYLRGKGEISLRIYVRECVDIDL